MSWFTATPQQTPVCQRCKSAQFAQLVKRSGEFDIYDCKKCGVIEPKRGKQ